MIKELARRSDVPLLFPKGGVGIELGVWHGDHAVTLFQCSKPKLLYLVDLWADEEIKNSPRQPQHQWGNFLEEVARKFTEEIKDDRVVLKKSGSIDFLHTLEENTLDWAYVDTNHEYQHTLSELNLLCNRVKPGGFICGHDFVVEPNAWRTGVVRSVTELIQKGNLEMTHLTNDRFPSFVCRNRTE